MIDSHCHLNHEKFGSDLEQALHRASQAGVEMLLVPGFDLPSSRKAVELTGKYPNLVASVGIHPHDADTLDDAALEELESLASYPKVVAIGEIGLDFYRDLSPRAVQITAFCHQIRLAHQLHLPIIIHQREAEAIAKDVFLTEQAEKLGGVWHCFSGSPDLADFAVENGFCIGIAGPVTYKNPRGLDLIAARVPAENLLVETDSPYLPPHPHRGQRNEPALLPLIAQRLAELRQSTVGHISEITAANFSRIFNL